MNQNLEPQFSDAAKPEMGNQTKVGIATAVAIFAGIALTACGSPQAQTTETSAMPDDRQAAQFDSHKAPIRLQVEGRPRSSDANFIIKVNGHKLNTNGERFNITAQHDLKNINIRVFNDAKNDRAGYRVGEVNLTPFWTASQGYVAINIHSDWLTDGNSSWSGKHKTEGTLGLDGTKAASFYLVEKDKGRQWTNKAKIRVDKVGTSGADEIMITILPWG